MKVYLDITNEVIQKVEDTKRVFTGDMTSKLEVVPKAGQTFANKFILLSAKLPNGRNVGPKEADNGATTSLYTFTLSKENGFALVKGLTNFYIWVGDTTTNMQKCYGAVVTNINEAVSVGDSSYFIQVDDSTAEEILHDLQNDMSSLSSTVASVTGRVATAERDISDLDANMTEVFRVQANHSTRINALENGKQNKLEDGDITSNLIANNAVSLSKLSPEIREIISNIPSAMIFKGTLGSGGTITTLPPASSSNTGYTYKVITAGSYRNIIYCDVGDLVISNGSVWVLIPSGDDDDAPEEYIIYAHASYNEQTGKDEYSIVGTPDFPFLVDDETRISDVKSALEGIKVLLYIDTETSTGSGEPWNVVELTLNRIYHSDDGLVTEAYFVSPYIQNYIYEHGNKLIQFEICYDQEGMSDGGLENVTQTTYLKYTEKSLNYYTKPETENYVQNKFNQYIFNVDIRDEEIYDHDDFSNLFMGVNDKDSKELDSFKVRIIFGVQYLADVYHSILPLVSVDQVSTTVTYTFQNDDYYVIVTQSGFSDETFTITWGETTAPYYSKSAIDTMLDAKENTSNKVTSLNSSSTNAQYPSAKAVYDLIEALPEPMLFKGTLGTNGTITTLPAASSSNEGFTYKVIENGTYASQQAAVGDVFVSNGSEWVLIPSGDEAVVSDTWRTIQVNGTDLLGNGIGTGKANFKSGSGIKITGSGNDITFALAELLYSATKTYAANQVALYNGYLFLSLVASNIGNTPDSTQDTAYWARVFV